LSFSGLLSLLSESTSPNKELLFSDLFFTTFTFFFFRIVFLLAFVLTGFGFSSVEISPSFSTDFSIVGLAGLLAGLLARALTRLLVTVSSSFSKNYKI
jgi:hypothetical protein